MDERKIDAAFLGALKLWEQYHDPQLLEAHSRLLAIGMDAAGDLFASVFVRCAPDADLRAAAGFGVSITQTTGAVRTASLPIDAVGPLSDLEGVSRIAIGHQLQLQMDVATTKANVGALRRSSGRTGSGVVIGIIDSGIDASHHAFHGRINRIWDQSVSGPGVKEGAYGHELIGAAMVQSQDTAGHGTHVAGIAAGNDAQFGGIAPGAVLVVVKTALVSTSASHAIDYIYRVAGELGMPAVINLSMTSHHNAHDGTDEFSQFVDTFTGTGRLMCAAAGNQGDDHIHARLDVDPGMAQDARFKVPPAVISLAILTVWCAAEADLEVSVQSPNGSVTDALNVSGAQTAGSVSWLPEGEVRLTANVDPLNGDMNIVLELRAPNPNLTIPAGVWRLRLRNTGKARVGIDAWAIDDSGNNLVFLNAHGPLRIGSPGCASRVVTVGSYTSRVKWTDAGGHPQRVGLALDDVSEFSSSGPLRGGGRKPDLVAPGAMIVGQRSAAASVDAAYEVGAHHLVMSGTSMASPFVAGLLALMLEKDRTLTPEGARAELLKHCRIPNRPGGTFDSRWGHGLIVF